LQRGVVTVGEARTAQFHVAGLEAGIDAASQFEQCQAVFVGRESALALVRRAPRGHEEHALETQRLGDAARDVQVPCMHRVEGPAQPADARGGHAPGQCRS